MSSEAIFTILLYLKYNFESTSATDVRNSILIFLQILYF